MKPCCEKKADSTCVTNLGNRLFRPAFARQSLLCSITHGNLSCFHWPLWNFEKRGITCMFAAFSKGFQTHRSMLEFSLMKIVKYLDVTKAAWLIVMTCLWRWCLKKMCSFQGFCRVMVLKPVMKVALQWWLRLSQILWTTPNWVKYQRMRWELSDSDDHYFLQTAGDVILQTRTAPRSRKRQGPLKSLRNYVHCRTVAIKYSIGGLYICAGALAFYL